MPDTIDPRAVALEAMRVLPQMRTLSPENFELLEDIVDGVTDEELADRYTSGNRHQLRTRLQFVLVRQLGFDTALLIDEIRIVLRIALERLSETAQ